MQTYVSESLAGLDYKGKHGLLDYTDSLKPIVVFGMYRDYEFNLVRNHNSDVTIVWCGSDAKDLSFSWAWALGHCKHIAISKSVQNSLMSKGIYAELKYLNATIPVDKNCPNGDNVFFYSSDDAPEIYGEQYINQIGKITGLNIIRATHNTYSKEQLHEVYKSCFVNLRLTKHDGCPHTNLEMGLLGRRSIFNGELPHSIAWKSIYDVCETLTREYQIRNNNNQQITNDFINFINANKL